MKLSDKVHAESDALRTSMYQLVGEALTTFNILEDYLRTCNAHLVGIKDVLVIEIIFGKLAARQLIDIFESLSLLETSHDPFLLTQQKDLVHDLRQRADERNMLAHAIWGIDVLNNDQVSIYHTRYKRASRQEPIGSFSELFSEAQLKEFGDKATHTYLLLEAFTGDIIDNRNKNSGAG